MTTILEVTSLSYLLTVDEVAAVLRTTRKAVYKRIQRGLLPGVIRDGRRILIRRDDLLAWLREGCAPSLEHSR